MYNIFNLAYQQSTSIHIIYQFVYEGKAVKLDFKFFVR